MYNDKLEHGDREWENRRESHKIQFPNQKTTKKVIKVTMWRKSIQMLDKMAEEKWKKPTRKKELDNK